MTLRSTPLVFLFALAQPSCVSSGGAPRSGGLASPDQVWGEARSGQEVAAGPRTPAQLIAQAQAARDKGRHAACADLAAEAAHALPDGDRRGRATLRLLEARCRRAAGQLGVALRSLSEAWPDLNSPTDRAWASAQAQEIALGGLGRSEAAAFVGRIDGDLANAWLGVRLALLAHERGDAATARQRLEAVADKLQAIGAGAQLAAHRSALGAGAGAAPRALGAVLPLSGPLRRVGRRALRGLLVHQGLAVIVRDTGGDPARAAQAVADLAKDPAILGVIGPLDRTAATAAAAEAQAAGLPLIALSVDAGVTAAGDQVFRNFLDPAGEAQAVGRFAVTDRGLARVAVLRPANGYGDQLARAFSGAVAAAGGAVVQTQVYRGRAFGPAIKALAAGPSFDGLFIPDSHAGVALIAPHLAAAGLRSSDLGVAGRKGADRKDGGDRPIQLLGAGAWAHRDLLAHGGDRYLHGAVFAAGWWPNAAQAEAVRLSSQLTERGGEAEAFAAYAYDSARRLGLAAAGGGDRAAVRDRLASSRSEGPVATLGFGPTRNPDAPPHLVVVRPVGLSALPRKTP